ncbi:hypothetical protein B0O99DRAFT_652681 [Bisporella sp. PMI_857]|nr:hypothetical protein B0O99DRAFT_652681 [Bisporella sp. PMI_857]
MEGSEGYPFNLPSYHLVFDDGKFCEEELNNPSTSWRSEEYPCNSNVLILDHHQGAHSQPDLRIVLLQPAVKVLLADQVRKSEKTMKILDSNRLIHPRKTVQPSKLDSEYVAPNHMDVSREALLKILTHYRIAPAACSHIRGQEQIYGSSTTHGSNGEIEAIQFWYAIRARAFIPYSAVAHESDLKITIITRYDVKARKTFVLLKYRSFNDLADVLKQELVEKLEEFIYAPSTKSTIADPFIPSILHFSSTIQYYRRAAREPRDGIRREERKAHNPATLHEIDLQRVHLNLASLDQDKIQLTFILGVITRLQRQHDEFYRLVMKQPNLEDRPWLWTRVEEEYDRFTNHISYCRDSVVDVAARADRLMNLTFNLNARLTSQQAVSENVSMQVIAIITMLFLPGTFVMGVFGSNFIAGPDREHKDTKLLVSSQWWVCVVVVISLTALVMGVWYFWRKNIMILYTLTHFPAIILQPKHVRGWAID